MPIDHGFVCLGNLDLEALACFGYVAYDTAKSKTFLAHLHLGLLPLPEPILEFGDGLFALLERCPPAIAILFESLKLTLKGLDLGPSSLGIHFQTLDARTKGENIFIGAREPSFKVGNMLGRMNFGIFVAGDFFLEVGDGRTG